MHGGGSTKVCKVKHCVNLVQARSLCTLHGGNGKCKVNGCRSGPSNGSQHCIKHGGKKGKPCSASGCTTTAARKGLELCAKHGGRPEQCRVPGCSNGIASWLKVCQTHGAFGDCQHPSGCSTANKFGGNCKKHTK